MVKQYDRARIDFTEFDKKRRKRFDKLMEMLALDSHQFNTISCVRFSALDNGWAIDGSELWWLHFPRRKYLILRQTLSIIQHTTSDRPRRSKITIKYGQRCLWLFRHLSRFWHFFVHTYRWFRQYDAWSHQKPVDISTQPDDIIYMAYKCVDYWTSSDVDCSTRDLQSR